MNAAQAAYRAKFRALRAIFAPGEPGRNGVIELAARCTNVGRASAFPEHMLPAFPFAFIECEGRLHIDEHNDGGIWYTDRNGRRIIVFSGW